MRNSQMEKPEIAYYAIDLFYYLPYGEIITCEKNWKEQKK